ncbi:hypothetical protein Tco_0592792 [Tanacetum coccineum]
MLTKPQFFYDHTTKQALGFQNPFYLKKLSSWNKAYEGKCLKNTSAIVIPDSEKTLMLTEESRLKMFLKQKDLMMLEKKVNTTPIDYTVLNQLSQDFETRFVLQTELSAEQAFWSQNSVNSFDLTPSSRPTKVEVPKELLKVSMVNTSCGTNRLDSKTFEVKMNQVLNETEQLLEQVINKDTVNIIMNSSVDNASVNMHECKKCLKLEIGLLNKKDFIEKETYNKVDNSVSNQSTPSFDQYFELNELKAQSQEKDTVIKKLKERIKSISGNINEDKVKKDLEEIEMINIELDHRVSNLIAENEHLKQTYKQLYDSIKPAPLKDELRKLKRKDLANNVVCKHTIDLKMLKIDVEYLNPRLLNNRSAHSNYLTHTHEEAAILREIVKQGKSQNPLNESLDSSCKYTKQIQELLIIVRQTCPSINNSKEKLVVVTPKNKDKRVRFTEPVTSSGNTITKIASSSNLVSNKPMVSSTEVKSSTSASGSQPSGNTKKDKI